MKKIFSIIAVTAGALMAASCSDFLDQSSESEHTDGDVWESTYYTSLRVNKLYGALGQDRTYSQDLAIVWNMNSDCELVDGLGNNATVTSSERGAMNYNMDPGWTKINDLWTAMYGIVEDANVNIKNIKESSIYTSGSKSDKELMQRYLGESLTLRAMVYFDLVRIFGDIPFKTDPSASDLNNVYMGKTDRDEIMDRLMTDLEEAINYLPWADDATNFTTEHVTKGYAHGLLGQIALTKAGWAIRESAKPGYETASNADDKTISDAAYPTQRPDAATRNALLQKAVDHFAALISSGKHNLNPSFGNEWYLINQLVLDQTYRENIFEMPMGENYTGELGYTVGVRLNGKTSEYGYSNSAGKMKLTAPLLYSYENGDTRRDITISPMEIKEDDGKTIESMLGNVPFALYVGKWDVRKMSASWLANNLVAEAKHMTGINPVKMRFANVLLWFAEAMNELYGPTATNAVCGLSAYDALARVHNRAFTVNNGTDEKPSLTPNPQDGNTFLTTAKASQENMFEAIVQENAWEFAGEGFRKYDLIRWNLLYAKIKEFKQNYLTQLESGIYQEKLYFNYKNEAKTKIDMTSITWNGLPAGKAESDYAGNVNSFGSSKLNTGKDTQVDTNLPSISSGLTGEYGVTVNVRNRYIMPLGSTTISASNGTLHNSYGYSD
ncbi:MAG: RagB/SusD family nutrient uptake outer membrane protein [Prevotella sp.]|nr:RagB/SusD family nutrient uptake outer membrane protein [Prevotella sp.]MBP3842459.1 RagB/SusD family nutrient uptake outer membrane protein [Prevotella sp.]